MAHTGENHGGKYNHFEIEPISAIIVTKDFFNPKKVQKGKSWPNIITWMNVTSVHEGRKPFKYELKQT